MISILFGPGGSGKSLLQVLIVIRKLRHTQQNISTNLALDVPRLCEYCEEQYPTESLRILERVRILTVEETKTFWKHRGPARYQADMMGEGVVCYDEGKNGTCFIIDEAGAAGFNAQGWAQGEARTTRGVECCWYLDQQRKFGDDVIASANGRTPNAIAKGFRDKAHEFVKMRNGYLRQMGIFRGRGKFTAKYYASEPGEKTEAFKEEDFVLDAKGLASCYRTQDGVGVSGGPADIGRRAKGIPVMWAFPMAIGAASLCIVVPWLLTKVLNKAQARVVQTVETAKEQTHTGRAGIGEFSRDAEASGAESRQAAPVVYVDGLVSMNGGWTAFLTDGRILRAGQIVGANEEWIVTVTGDMIRFKPKTSVGPKTGLLASSP